MTRNQLRLIEMLLRLRRRARDSGDQVAVIAISNRLFDLGVGVVA